ncbi:MAG: P27 family phage terminase small subunit [Clostridia bacterium]|nr:P27 family phage terminase small subunit [Clostridia bacterium]
MQKYISDRIRSSKKYHAIRQDLLDQLKAAGLDSEVNRDLVEQYMSLWVVERWTEFDIRKRGPVITYNNGGGQNGTKENPSLAYQLKLGVQMLKILKHLGLSVDSAACGGDSFDGL